MKHTLIHVAAVLFAANAYAVTSTTTSSSVVVPTSQTSVSVTASEAGAIASPWKASYLGENVLPAASTNRGRALGANGQHHVGLAYKLDETQTVQFRQYAYYNSTDFRETNEWGLGDHAFQYSNTGLSIGSTPVSQVYARIYLPGATTSREVGKYELRLLGEIVQEVSSAWNVEYSVNPRFYAYSSESNGQRVARLLPTITLKYARESKVKPYISAFTDHSWKHTGKGLNLFGDKAGKIAEKSAVNSDLVYADIGVEFDITKNINLNIFAETGKDLRSSDRFLFLKDDATEYNVNLAASL